MTRHPDYQALLRAVIAEPDDDLPRLILADWLDEHSCPERAEFICVQCELATIGHLHPPADDEDRQIIRRHNALRRRERELLALHDAFWVPEAIHHLNLFVQEDVIEGADICFRRGFVAEIALSWPDWLVHHAALLDACPIRNARDGLVRLTTPPALRFFAASPHLVGQWSLGGCQRRHAGIPAGDGWAPPPLAGMLAAEWPGVRFELPAAAPDPRRSGNPRLLRA